MERPPVAAVLNASPKDSRPLQFFARRFTLSFDRRASPERREDGGLSRFPTIRLTRSSKTTANQLKPAGDEPATTAGMVPLTSLLQFSMFSKWRDASTPISRGWRWLSPCMFGHGDMLRTRDAEGQPALECVDCGHVSRIVLQPSIKGPMHCAVPVPGAPVLKVKRLHLRDRSYPRSA